MERLRGPEALLSFSPGKRARWILNGAAVAMAAAGLAAACSACRDRAGSVILREGSRKGGPRASRSFGREAGGLRCEGG